MNERERGQERTRVGDPTHEHLALVGGDCRGTMRATIAGIATASAAVTRVFTDRVAVARLASAPQTRTRFVASPPTSQLPFDMRHRLTADAVAPPWPSRRGATSISSGDQTGLLHDDALARTRRVGMGP